MSDTTPAAPLRVAVIGLGYVGLPTAVGLAALGHDVTGIDTDGLRIDMLRDGRVPMHEPGLQAALAEHQSRIDFTDSLDDALASSPEIVMIAVQTPGEGGTSYVEDAARSLGRQLRAPATVVLRSTAPLGTTLLIADILAREFGATVPVACNPEFLVEGRAYESLMKPDRIVIGVQDDATADLMTRLYAGIQAPLLVTSFATAEIAKYAANAMLATQISFINEMADLAEATGADIAAVSRILGLDPRIGRRAYLTPGIGFGGSCLPKDLRALIAAAEARGVELGVARAVNAANETRAGRIVDRLREVIGPLPDKRIAVWGLAFKGGTDDVRESPAISVVQQLVAAGAVVRAYDALAEHAAAPFVGRHVLCDQMYEPLVDADALLVLTNSVEFAGADFHEARARMRGALVIDGRNILPAPDVREAGLVLLRVGDGGTEAGQMAHATSVRKEGRA